MRKLRGCLVLLTAVLTACGGAAHEPVATPSTTSSGGGAAIVATPEDRSPAARPSGLALQVHLSAPKTIARALKAQIPIVGAKIDARAVLGNVLGSPTLAQIVDVEAAVDGAIAVVDGDSQGDGVHAAYAFGVEEGIDLVARLKGVFRIEQRAGGVLKLVPARTAKWDDPELGSYNGDCLIVPALGKSKHRLVCSPNNEKKGSLAHLGAWLARGVTQLPDDGNTAHVALDVAVLRQHFDKDLQGAHDELANEAPRWISLGKPHLDKVLQKLGRSLVDEAFDLFADLDAMTLDVSLATAGVRVSSSLTFGHATSWTARAALSNADSMGPLPAALSKMPGDGAFYASFAHAANADDALLVPVTTTLRDLVVATAEDFSWPAKDRDNALEVVRLTALRAADTALVIGEPKGAQSTAGGAIADRWEMSGYLASVARRGWWSIAAAERDSKGAIELGKAIAAMVSKPSFATTLEAITDKSWSIKITTKNVNGTELPKGSFDQTYDVTLIERDATKPSPGVKSGPAKPKETVLAHFVGEELVVPEGATRTWSCWAQNGAPGELLARVKDAVAGTTKHPLTQREGFDFLSAKGSVSSGVFAAIDGLVRAFAPTAQGASDVLSALPDAGRSASTLRTVATRNGGGGSLDVSMFVPRDAIAAIATDGVSLFGRIF